MYLLILVAVVLTGGVAGAQGRAHEAVGRKVTAIPLVNFSSDDGAGYGLRVSLFEYDGETVPYSRAYSVQGFFTTEGKWVHRLYLDMPGVRPGQRVEVEAVYEKEDFANYYGGLSEARADAIPKARRTFQQNYPKLNAMWVREIQGPWRLRLGGRLGHNRITPNATAGSLLTALNPTGANGGTLAQVNGAVWYDTRDNYVDSAKGVLEELLVEYGFGEGFNGGKLSYEHRHFFSPTEGLVFAHRVQCEVTFGDVPFYEASSVGGSSTVRGVPSARWRGEGRVLLNAELRFRGVRLSERRQIYVGGLVFGDAGQVFDRKDGPSMDEWKAGVGAGLRFSWHSTIVRADYGVANGKTGLYITFSQVF